MPRPRKPEPKRSVHLVLNRDLLERLDRSLMVDGKVPQASYQRFVEEAIRQHFEWGVLDLGRVYPDRLPAGSLVKGPHHLIEVLERVIGSDA